MSAAHLELIAPAELDQALADPSPLTSLRHLRRRADERLAEGFRQGLDVATLVAARAAAVDALLRAAWETHVDATQGVSLIAVGGYGRGELHPCSDIDLLILESPEQQSAQQAHLESFLTFLWDIGLEVGHSVRTVAECADAATEDITVATNLMESRLLAGDPALYMALSEAIGPEQLWPARTFFAAKRTEQEERHERYHGTAYKLEPNVKESPGGLRDIQMIGWVVKRHFGADTLHELVGHDFLTEDEYRSLIRGQNYLWRVRFALHLLAGRREDRLLFDYQPRLAEMFGFQDTPESLGVEQFMQEYYRTVMELSRLNEMLLQLFDEAIITGSDANIETLDARYQSRNGFLELRDAASLEAHPEILLEVFHVLQQHPQFKGLSAQMIRLIRRHRDRIDARFRAEQRHRDLFVAILREPAGVTHELRRMNRYGILGRYIPAFGAIVGRMQYDLFHAYTVDEHILFVVSNLRRFALPRFNHEFPLCSALMQGMDRPELAYLAGLFHDIAKGRGGDHSQLGKVDAREFCLAHGFAEADADLVAWLVEHHLLLSVTSQKKDITDPRVLHDFAQTMGDKRHLDYLYMLTVADVRGTNPELWNSWKATLFRELYDATKELLRLGLDSPPERERLIAETKREALELLQINMSADSAQQLWSTLPEEYFLRHTADEIAWHTTVLAEHESHDDVVVSLREHQDRGATVVFIRTAHDPAAFARATGTLDQLNLTILDARVVTLPDGESLHTYVVLEDTGEPITDAARLERIRQGLEREMQLRDTAPRPVSRRTPRQLKVFSTPLNIDFGLDELNRRSILEIVAADRPGLLSTIGRAFQSCGVRLQNAKITTVGERAEDVFFITDEDGRPLIGAPEQARLRDTLTRLLDRNRDN